MTEVVVVDRSVRVSSQAAFDPAVEFKSWFWRFWLLNHFLRFLVLLAVRSLRNLGTRTWSRGGLLCVAPTRSQSISNNQDCRSKSSRSLSLIHGSSTTLVGYKKSMFLSVRKLSASRVSCDVWTGERISVSASWLAFRLYAKHPRFALFDPRRNWAVPRSRRALLRASPFKAANVARHFLP